MFARLALFAQFADPRRGERQLADASGQAERVPDRVRHRRAGRADAALARAHHAERVARRRGVLADQEVDRRDFGRGRHPVLDERDRLGLARVVVAELLEQRPADALGHAAAQLTLDQHGVDGPADPPPRATDLDTIVDEVFGAQCTIFAPASWCWPSPANATDRVSPLAVPAIR